MNTLARLAIISTIGAPGLSGQSVSISAGNVIYRARSGVERAITSVGLDSMPSLSPDGRWIVFVRRTPGDTVNTSLGWEERTELWVAGTDGSHARRLVRGHEGNTPESSLARFDAPLFSLDSKTVYFGSRGWVTSDALHAVNLSTGHERFVCAANGFELLKLGPYLGDFMVGQHRYGATGSYDGTWVVSPRGQVVRLVTTDGAPDAEERLAAFRSGKVPKPGPLDSHPFSW